MIARPRVRQLGLGDLLDETFRIYRSGFVTFVAIAALVYVPYALLNLVLALPLNEQLGRLQTATNSLAASGNPQDVFAMLGGMVFWALGTIGLSLVYSVVFDPLLQGALARAVSRHYLGRQISVGDSFGTALRRAWPLIGSRMLVLLLGSPVLLVGFALYFAALFAVFSATPQFGSPDPPFSSIFGPLAIMFLAFGIIIVSAIVFLFIWTRLVFVLQAAVVEQHGAWGSIQRSWRLTRGYFWRTLGFLLVIALLGALVSLIPTAVFTLPVQFLFPDNIALQTTVSTVISSIVAVIVTPFSLIAYTLMYYDLRVRKEAFDLEQRADVVLPPATGYGLPGAA